MGLNHAWKRGGCQLNIIVILTILITNTHLASVLCGNSKFESAHDTFGNNRITIG